MIDKRVYTSEAALAGIGDGASLMVSGFGGVGVPAALLRAFDASVSATDLTLITNTPRFVDTYAPRLFGERRVARIVASAARGREGEAAVYETQWASGELAVEISPQGSFSERLRAGGAGIAAFYTPTGAGTKLGEGKETRSFDGRPCVLETALTADFALLRGDLADRWGNIVFRGAQANFGPAMAAAAAVAIVEVERISDAPLEPARVDIPGIYVERVIAMPDAR